MQRSGPQLGMLDSTSAMVCSRDVFLLAEFPSAEMVMMI
jgi:hypothetical protein